MVAPQEKEPRNRWRRRLARGFGGLIVAMILAILIVFPGRQTPMALTLATGIGVPGLQVKVDRLEEKAILGQEFTEEDKAFLLDLYTCCAKGGKLIIVARQSGFMMDRYLDASGEDLFTAPRIFLGSQPVRHEMQRMREWLLHEAATRMLVSRTIRGIKAVTDQESGGSKDRGCPKRRIADEVSCRIESGFFHGQVRIRKLFDATHRNPACQGMATRAAPYWQPFVFGHQDVKHGPTHDSLHSIEDVEGYAREP